MKLLIATGNSGKRQEFEVLLKDALKGAEIYDLKDWPTPVPEVDEDGDTFEYNALKKALETSENTGVSTLADDSGLVVDALDGAPGVHSARWAGGGDADNNAKLVTELSDVPPDKRSARYVAVLAMCLLPGPLQDQALRGLGVRMEDLPELGLGEITADQPGRRGDRLLFCRRGTCEGMIVLEPRGEGGFGYDPYFLIPEWDLTFAQVELSRKNVISHRAVATRKVFGVLEA